MPWMSPKITKVWPKSRPKVTYSWNNISRSNTGGMFVALESWFGDLKVPFFGLAFDKSDWFRTLGDPIKIPRPLWYFKHSPKMACRVLISVCHLYPPVMLRKISAKKTGIFSPKTLILALEAGGRGTPHFHDKNLELHPGEVMLEHKR